MDKQAQFLWGVQTIVLTNSVNLATNPERLDRFRHVMSATGMTGLVDDALYASERIPADMTASEAATEFCGWALENIREPADRCPPWARRY